VQIDEDALKSNTSEEVETTTETPKKKPSLRILE
jgi:stringent starvation protein B